MWFNCLFGLLFLCMTFLSVSGVLVGAYVPQRDQAGKLLPKQCHGSTGFCWCINADGTQKGAAVGPGVPLVCY